MRNLDWLNDIEWADLLSGDSRLVYDAAGPDTLLKLWASLPSINLYISEKPLDEARRRYIYKKFDGSNTKELAALLGCSSRFVHKVLAERAKPAAAPKEPDQGKLF